MKRASRARDLNSRRILANEARKSSEGSEVERSVFASEARKRSEGSEVERSVFASEARKRSGGSEVERSVFASEARKRSEGSEVERSVFASEARSERSERRREDPASPVRNPQSQPAVSTRSLNPQSHSPAQT
jgi:hypothetical protein